MPTPFAEFANCRMAWHRATSERTSLREGMRTATDSVVLEAKIKVQGPSGEQDSGGRSIGAGSCVGYITRWAVVPSGGGWLDTGASWAWNDTGLRPDELPRGEKLEAFIGKLSELPTTNQGEKGYITIATLTGEGGIDAIKREAAGDKFTGTFAAGR